MRSGGCVECHVILRSLTGMERCMPKLAEPWSRERLTNELVEKTILVSDYQYSKKGKGDRFSL